jgi:hypothetical protein
MVEGVIQLFFAQAEVGDFFGFEMFDQIGPFPHYYDSGMHSAIGSLWQSQQPGQHETKQKYSSVHKVRSLHTNMYNASAKSASSTLVLLSEKGGFISTTAPSDREKHVRFMIGLHAWIGDRRKCDAAISIEQMLAIQELLEAEWCDASKQQESMVQRWIAKTACFFLVGNCGRMCRFELPKALLTNLRHSLHLEDDHHGHRPHVGGIFFLGHFKACSNAEKTILVFLAAVMDSRLRPALWLDCLAKTLEGRAFSPAGYFKAPKRSN